MNSQKHEIGEKIGMLTIIGYAYKKYKCKCDCGKECEKKVSYFSMHEWRSKSCGCVAQTPRIHNKLIEQSEERRFLILAKKKEYYRAGRC